MAVQPGNGAPDFVIPDALPVLPLRDAVVLPLTAVPPTVPTRCRSSGPGSLLTSARWARSTSFTECRTAPSA